MFMLLKQLVGSLRGRLCISIVRLEVISIVIVVVIVTIVYCVLVVSSIVIVVVVVALQLALSSKSNLDSSKYCTTSASQGTWQRSLRRKLPICFQGLQGQERTAS